MAQQHGRREAPQTQKRRRHHPIRNTIIVLIILALLGYAGYRFALPVLADHIAAQVNDQPSVSTSAEAEDEITMETESSEEPEIDAEPEPEEELEAETEAEAEPEETVDPLLLLVNKENALPEGYEDFLVLTELSNGTSVAEEIYPDLQEMFDDMRAQGIYPVVASGYRTAEEQQKLMDERIASYVEQGYTQEDAEAEALLWVNPVGYSEHQTGLAVDINADGINSEGSTVYNWLAEYAWEYGFILRYPEDKTDVTGTDYEAWHYRYVGRENAKLIYESGLTLEEFLAQ